MSSNMVVARKNHGLIVALLVVLLIFSLNNSCLASRTANWDVVPPGCMNCTICPYACHPLNPPPPPSLPDGEVLSPPPPVLPYPSDVGPPSPPQSNCTTVPVQCCQYPTAPTTTTTTPPPNTISPPLGFGYQPVVNHSAPLSHGLSISVMMILLLSIVADLL